MFTKLWLMESNAYYSRKNLSASCVHKHISNNDSLDSFIPSLIPFIFPSCLTEQARSSGWWASCLTLELKVNNKRFALCMFLFWVALSDLSDSTYQIM